jgi:hypothetical protein
MLNQGTYNQGEEYEHLKDIGTFTGFLCGAPVFKKFHMDDIRPGGKPFFNCYGATAKAIKAGVQPANQMGRVTFEALAKL